jgi:hypothetical protein
MYLSCNQYICCTNTTHEKGTLTITPLVRFRFLQKLLVIFITINTFNTYILFSCRMFVCFWFSVRGKLCTFYFVYFILLQTWIQHHKAQHRTGYVLLMSYWHRVNTTTDIIHIYNLLPGFFKGVQPKFQTGTSSGTGLSGKRENANWLNYIYTLPTPVFVILTVAVLST